MLWPASICCLLYTSTARKVVAHGPLWIYVAIAVGMDKAGTESPLMIVQGAGTYGSEDTTENEMKMCIRDRYGKDSSIMKENFFSSPFFHQKSQDVYKRQDNY